MSEENRQLLIKVKDLHADFTYDQQRLETRGGRAYGPGFLLTLDGSTDFGKREYALEGTFAPATTLAKVIGKIPLINWILLGPHEKGFVAVNFSVSGTFDDPEIHADPLSALTPGITRTIQEIFKD